MSAGLSDVHQVMSAQAATAQTAPGNYGTLEGEYISAGILPQPIAVESAAERMGFIPGEDRQVPGRSDALDEGIGDANRLGPNDPGISEPPAELRQHLFREEVEAEAFHTPPRTTRYELGSMATWATGVERAQTGLSWMARLGDYMRARSELLPRSWWIQTMAT